ncbi:MAG: extracellular solute-binding protein [Anaerolineales bacterium]
MAKSPRGTLAGAAMRDPIDRKTFAQRLQSIRPKPLRAGAVALAVVLLSLSACSPLASPTSVPGTATPTEPPPTSTATPTKEPVAPSGAISIWLDWGPAEMLALERIVDHYRGMNPGVEFRISYHRPESLRADFEAAIAAGDELPSLLLGPSSWGDALFETGGLRDVGGSLLPEQRQAIHPFAWSQVDRGEVVVGLPLGLNGTVLYRNVQLASVSAQSVGDLVEAANDARLTGAVGASLDLGFNQSAPMIRTCKGELHTEQDVDPVTRPIGLCWLRLLSRLGQAGPVTFNTDEDLVGFEDGKSAWLLESTDKILELQDAIGESNLEIDPWPIYQPTGEQLYGYVWTENGYFPTAVNDADFEATWSFAVYLLAPDNQRLLGDAQGVRHLPVLQSVTLDDQLLAEARAILLSGSPLPDQRLVADIVGGLSTAIRLSVGQGGDPELALELALGQIREARIPTPTPTFTPAPTITPTPSLTPPPTPPPG